MLDKEIEISSIDFYIQKSFLLITTLENQIIFISPELDIMEITFQSSQTITETLVFEHEKSVYLCFGLSNGNYIVENQMRIL